MFKRCFFLFVVGLHASDSFAQNKQRPCTSPECHQFDFWTGKWNLIYNDTMHATNNITKEMNGCVVHEHFSTVPNSYCGESWSVFNPQTKKWQQTWVDNQGAYITLEGTFGNDEMILYTRYAMQPDSASKQNRMTYSDIQKNSFNWDWASTTDSGKTWKNLWHIHYERRK